MGVDDIAKFIAHPLQWRIRAARRAQLAELVLDDAAHQSRCMGEIGRQFFRIARGRWGGDGQRHEGCGEAIRIAGATNGAFGVCVGGRRVDRLCGHDLERVDQFAAMIDAQAHEIGDGPDRQRLKPLVLPLVMGVFVAGGVVGLVGRLQFHERPRRLARPFQRDVRPPDPRRGELGNHSEAGRGHKRQNRFQPLLEGGGERLFKIRGLGLSQFANALCVSNECSEHLSESP